jgi:DNA-binding response OmpR family regulator
LSSDGQSGRRILAVDPDAVSLRFVEMALALRGFELVTAKSGEAALEILRAEPIDLLVADTDLGDMSGLALLRRLGQEKRLRDLPFLFLSADRRTPTKVAAFDAGVDDYLLKPCDAAEFAARCEALVSRRRRARLGQGSRGYSLAGDFTGIGFADLISLLELGKRSGVLSLVSSRRSGELQFSEGRVVHGLCGNLVGPEAFHCFFSEEAVQFEFAPGAPLVPEEEQSITESVMSLLMEAARRYDTARRDSQPALPKVVARQSSSGVRGIQLARGPAADARLARQLELALRDPFTLGELRLFDLRQLAAWTKAEVGRDRFHLHLIADLAQGVSALLPLGGGPTERWILEALPPQQKWFGLSFFLRGERTVDVLLLDARDLAPAQPSLQRVPSLVLFAPPDGELIGAGTRGRTTFDAYLRRLQPEALLAVGRDSLAASVGPVLADASPRSQVSAVTGELEGAGASLRDLLVSGITLWAAGAGEGR